MFAKKGLRRPIFLAGFLFLLGLAADSAGWQGNDFVNPNGPPKQFEKGKPAMFAVWHSANDWWHIRTTTAVKKRHFKGKIQVFDGIILKTKPHELETKGDVDIWKVAVDNKSLFFDFTTERGVDGIDFQVSKAATQIRFDLLLDNQRLTEVIFVGGKGAQPVVIPFSLPAHP